MMVMWSLGLIILKAEWRFLQLGGHYPILLINPRVGEQLFQFEPREVRRILSGQYEIRYEIQSETIYVLRLWHTREDR